jgi:hypothetical protein
MYDDDDTPLRDVWEAISTISTYKKLCGEEPTVQRNELVNIIDPSLKKQSLDVRYAHAKSMEEAVQQLCWIKLIQVMSNGSAWLYFPSLKINPEILSEFKSTGNVYREIERRVLEKQLYPAGSRPKSSNRLF